MIGEIYCGQRESHLVVCEEGAGEGGEGGAGWPGQDVLTLPRRVEARLRQHGLHAPAPAPGLPQLGGVREGEFVDGADGGDEHHHVAPALVHGDARQQRRVHEPVLDPVAHQVVVEADLDELERVSVGSPVERPVGKQGAVRVIGVAVASYNSNIVIVTNKRMKPITTLLHLRSLVA